MLITTNTHQNTQYHTRNKPESTIKQMTSHVEKLDINNSASSSQAVVQGDGYRYIRATTDNLNDKRLDNFTDHHDPMDPYLYSADGSVIGKTNTFFHIPPANAPQHIVDAFNQAADTMGVDNPALGALTGMMIEEIYGPNAHEINEKNALPTEEYWTEKGWVNFIDKMSFKLEAELLQSGANEQLNYMSKFYKNFKMNIFGLA